MTPRTQRGLCAACLAVLALAGCGPARGSLSGKVTYNGKRLASGAVLLLGSDGIPVTAPIGPDGSYQLDNVPTGPARLGVSSPDPAEHERKIANWSAGRGRVKDRPGKTPPAPAPAMEGKGWFPIPPKFATPEQSGLTYTIQGRGDTHPIELKD